MNVWHMTAADTTVSDRKARIRQEALALRDALPPAVRAAAAGSIAARSFPLRIEPGVVVSGFSPMKSEIDPVPLMRKLADNGARLALPVIAGRGKPLIMRAWNFGDPLVSGQWGIREPTGGGAEGAPDILIGPSRA